jgi:hypothetical protein
VSGPMHTWGAVWEGYITFPPVVYGGINKQDGDNLLVLLKHLKVTRPSNSLPSGTWAIWETLLHSLLCAKICTVKAVCVYFLDLP